MYREYLPEQKVSEKLPELNGWFRTPEDLERIFILLSKLYVRNMATYVDKQSSALHMISATIQVSKIIQGFLEIIKSH